MRTAERRPRPSPRAGLACAALAVGALLAACGESAPPAPSKPSKDYAAEAKKTIDDKNMDTELEKLKSEIETDK